MRITDKAQLEGLPCHVRRQLEHHLEEAEAAPIREELRADYDGHPVKGERRPQPEQEEGRLLVQWIDLLVLPNGLKPGEFFYHVANAGVARGQVRGGILQGQGVRKGWPDYGLDLPLGPYHGLRLELKRIDGDKPSAEQLEILARLEAVGYKCCVAWGWEQARVQIDEYLDFAR